MYTSDMAVRSFKTKDKDGKGLFVVEFSGDQVESLELLKKKLELDQTQDVVRLALNLLVKMTYETSEMKHGGKKVK
jgi:hypothetical protein